MTNLSAKNARSVSQLQIFGNSISYRLSYKHKYLLGRDETGAIETRTRTEVTLLTHSLHIV